MGYAAKPAWRPARVWAMLVLVLLAASCAGPAGEQAQPAAVASTPAATASPTLVAPTATAVQGAARPPVESPTAAPAGRCEPTRADALGPFYEPDAPRRESVGRGYVLSGVVRAANGCAPIPGALIEFWLANPEGVYDDDHRATMQAGSQGEYRFESNAPVAYGGRPPHIHVKVSAPGYRDLVTQHYPQQGQSEARFDLVLVPR